MIGRQYVSGFISTPPPQLIPFPSCLGNVPKLSANADITDGISTSLTGIKPLKHVARIVFFPCEDSLRKIAGAWLYHSTYETPIPSNLPLTSCCSMLITGREGSYRQRQTDKAIYYLRSPRYWTSSLHHHHHPLRSGPGSLTRNASYRDYSPSYPTVCQS